MPMGKAMRPNLIVISKELGVLLENHYSELMPACGSLSNFT